MFFSQGSQPFRRSRALRGVPRPRRTSAARLCAPLGPVLPPPFPPRSYAPGLNTLLVREMIDTFFLLGLSFSAGLYKRRNIKGSTDADAVACMKRAGAILLGVTNVSELAMWWESHNYVHGRSCNPYNTSRIVGGSSGGEVNYVF